MQVFYNLEELVSINTSQPSQDGSFLKSGGFDLSKGSVLTIGNFDGVHLGHQSLINKVVSQAKTLGLCAGVLTFDPHPLNVLRPAEPLPLISSKSLRLEHIKKLGIDFLFMVNFTKDLAIINAESFVENYLVAACKVRHLIIGYDYSFGKNRRGDFALLQRLGLKHGFTVEQLEPLLVADSVVSSTRVRECISQTRLDEAAQLMGHFYTVEGEVVHGFKRGSTLLGFPTANIQHAGILLPKCGVYACFAELEGQFLPAVANIGYNPSFANKNLSLECHILGFKQDLYGRTLRLHLVAYLRGEEKCASLDDLIDKINQDIDISKPILDEALKKQAYFK